VSAFLWSGEMSPAFEPPVIIAEAPKQRIGSATMENEGTIVMRLRMTQGAVVGDLGSAMFPARRIIRQCVRICRA
jgi:hypothetical protein